MTNKNIEFLKMLYIRGPGVWAYRPVIEAWVNIGDLEDCPSDTIPGLYERLSAWLPGLVEHRCSPGVRGGFLKRLREGTWPGHILEHVTLELQTLIGFPDGMGRAREMSRRSHYRVVVSAPYEAVTRAALYEARDLVMAAIEDRAFDVDAAVVRLRALAEPLRLGPSTECIVEAAEQAGIPAIRLGDANLLQLGYGAASRRIWTAETDVTSAIAEAICSNKDLTRKLLQDCGVPVPEGRVVCNSADAWQAACEIGTPVVVKPCDGNHGRGVFTYLHTQEEVETAFHVAQEEGSEVVVERFISGEEHRLLVVGGRLIAAARGEAASVVGDGVRTIQQLIDLQLNSDPRRGDDEEHPLNTVRIDSAARIELARQGYTPESIPAAGVPVLIQRNGNVAIDVTDDVHPAVADAVTLAARVVGLDVAGIDLVARDISVPLEEQGGAIVEVNAGPGLLMHIKPAIGKPRPVGRAIVDHLFNSGQLQAGDEALVAQHRPVIESAQPVAGSGSGRIPIVGVTGCNASSLTSRLLGHILQLAGFYTGLAGEDGLYFDGRRVHADDSANWQQGRRVLLHRTVQAGIIQSTGLSILTEGLPYDRCQVGVVTDVDLALRYPDLDILEEDQLFSVFRSQVDVVLAKGAAVLNIDEPFVARMAELCDGEVIFFSAQAQPDAMLQQHVQGGGRAVTLKEGRHLVLLHASQDSPLGPLPGWAQTLSDRTAVLAGVAAAWALDVNKDVIRTALQTFQGQPPAIGASAAMPAAAAV